MFGMPKEAIARGGVDEIVPLSEMTNRVVLAVYKQGAGRSGFEGRVDVSGLRKEAEGWQRQL